MGEAKRQLQKVVAMTGVDAAGKVSSQSSLPVDQCKGEVMKQMQMMMKSGRALRGVLMVALLLPLMASKVFAGGGGATTTVFSYTGSDQSFTVPAGITSLTMKLWGAGGGGSNGAVGGGGAFVTGAFPVTPGESLTLIVGQGGGTFPNNGNYGGGGGAGFNGGRGGGRSAIRRASTELVTAAAGGGASAITGGPPQPGGAGGLAIGTSGGGVGGAGGTQTSGGAGGLDASSGIAFAGGNGASFAGGGGSGYFGGGGGGFGSAGPDTGGGGGGSSLLTNLTASGGSAAGSGTTPGGLTDTDYAGNIGTGGPVLTNGGNGRIVLLYVPATNNAPVVATNTGLTLGANSSATIDNTKLKVTDADSNPITYTLATAPTKGTLKLNGTSLAANDTFTQTDIDNNLLTFAAGSTVGSDSFDFSAADGQGGSVAGTFSITINEVPSLIVSTTSDVVDNKDKLTSLREAITYANSNADDSAITFDETVFAAPRKTIVVDGFLALTQKATITAPTAGVIIDGLQQFVSVFRVSNGISVGFDGLTISHGYEGIRSSGIVTLTNCTLTSNEHSGVFNFSSDGNNANIANLTNCTLSGSTRGLVNVGGTANLTNCTISGNPTGIYNATGSILNVQNSIVAGNNTDIEDDPTTNGGNNIIGGTAVAAGLDPAGLVSNGGPTPTIALVPGSPAVGKADPANAPATDQRGYPRPQPSGGKPDIGAFELEVLVTNNPTVTETPGGVSADFVVTLGTPALRAITFDAATQDYSATAGSDYTALSTTSYTINVGETSKTIGVPVLDDSLNEIQESFRLLLSNSNQASIRSNGGILGGRATINDNDPLPTAFTADLPTINEGNSGTLSLHFSVRLSAASGKTVVVTYSFGGTATYGSDYTAPGGNGGTLTFAPGQTNKAVTFVVQRDTLPEADETIRLQLLSATAGTLGCMSGTHVLLNVDVLPNLSINDVTLSEGSNGMTNFVFTVSLSKASGQPVTLSYQTGNGSAVKPGDYAGKAGTLTFAPNETSKTITVAVVGDTLSEADETFTVDLSNAAGATISDGQGQGTILNDDASN